MKRTASNWHPADIRAAISKKGTDLSRIARKHGLSPSTTSKALQAPCYKGEQAIAAALGLAAHAIWPRRYDSAGMPLHPRIRKQFNVADDTKASQKRVAI